MRDKSTTAADLTAPVYYGTYLRLDRLLAAQKPESARRGRPAHDEMLFIIVHQAYELWFKQILHELDRVQGDFGEAPLEDRRLGRIVTSLGRIVEILKLLVHQLDVLETMAPLDFLDFRDMLAPASGFQSLQFRLIETRLGLAADLRHRFDDTAVEDRLQADDRALLMAAGEGPKLVDQLAAWLARTPFVEAGGYAFGRAYRDAVVAMLEGDARTVRAASGIAHDRAESEAAAIEGALGAFRALFELEARAGAWRMPPKAVQAALFITLYRDEPVLQLPWRLLDTLMAIDGTMTLWRYRHALMVERMIGVKVGTGGSSGHDYLRRTAERHRVFGDLFHLSTYLIPRASIPPLPRDLAARMGFAYQPATPGRNRRRNGT